MARRGGKIGQARKVIAEREICNRIKRVSEQLGDSKLEKQIKRTIKRKLKNKC